MALYYPTRSGALIQEFGRNSFGFNFPFAVKENAIKITLDGATLVTKVRPTWQMGISCRLHNTQQPDTITYQRRSLDAMPPSDKRPSGGIITQAFIVLFAGLV